MKSKILLLLTITFIVILFSGCTDNNYSDDSSNDNTDDTNHGSVDPNWLENYTAVHNIGTGSNDFWLNFPRDSDYYGQIIKPFDWIQNSLDNNCVLFVVHKTGCEACQPQADRVINLSERYEEYVEFHDLDITLGGSIEERAYDAYIYDPDGSPGLIALTGVFTLIENNGSIEIGWHSWEKDVDYSELESWIKDSIYYHHINREG
jgi:hypothetical protein